MIVKLAGKNKKCIAVLVCLLIIGNSAHGTVLCFGADGHIELESAFHERCEAPVHYETSGQNKLLYEAHHHAEGKHCEPCIDIPISIGLTKVTDIPKQSNPAFLVPVAGVIVAADEPNPSAYNFSSNSFFTTSYFTPLSTIILLA
jgi:hypothetical protein